MKRNRSIIYLILIVGILLLAKFFFFPGTASDDNSKMNPAKGAGPMSSNVEGFVVKGTEVNNKLFVTGSILANENVDLRPEIAGKVSAITFKEGQPVQKGQLLLKIADEDLVAQLRKTQAQLKLALDKMNRLQELISVQGISREELDAAENEFKSLQADEEIIKVQISRTEIRAPFNGIVGLRNISEGSFITQQQIVAGIQQVNPLKLDFSVPERYAGIIKQNMDIDFTIEGINETFTGTVYAIDPMINTSTRSLKVRAHAQNPGNKITPGAFAKIEILMDKIKDALMIPTQSIVPVLKGQQVFVSREGVAEAVPVSIGIRQDKMVQITDGISAGDTVITTGVMGIKPGSTLRFMKVK